MKFRTKIESVFEGKAFELPLFYSYPGGLRFELEGKGSWIEQFQASHKKALEICSYIFAGSETVTLCAILRRGCSKLILHKSNFNELNFIELLPGREREIWKEQREDDWDGTKRFDHFFVYNISADLISSVLWCQCANDWDFIKPITSFDLYLMDFEKQVLVWVYDDRGMDVVGPNHDFMKELYTKFNHYLLDYDRVEMDATFAE